MKTNVCKYQLLSLRGAGVLYAAFHVKHAAEMTSEDLLRLQAQAWNVALDAGQLSALLRYADRLAGYELANVIGTADREVIVKEHLTDALSCLLVEDLDRSRSLLDVGTGGGLPGVPLGIARPRLSVTLLEATEKKVQFLGAVMDVLGLANLKVINARAEPLGREPDYRERHDVVTARALAVLPVVLEYCSPLVRSGGAVIAMKGGLSSEEMARGVAAAGELGLRLRGVQEVEFLPQMPQKERRLVIFDKVAGTPDRFPRRTGVAKKRPLGGTP